MRHYLLEVIITAADSPTEVSSFRYQHVVVGGLPYERGYSHGNQVHEKKSDRRKML